MSLITRITGTFTARSVRGQFDQCDAAGVSGWVVGNRAGERLQVEVLADGEPVLRIVADTYREDLATAGIGDGRHGFRTSLPQGLYDGRDHTIEVRETATGVLLPGSPKTFQAAVQREVRGTVDRCDMAGVSGWAASYAADERIRLEIVADGAPVLQAVADLYREDLAAAGIGDGRHGFRTSLPQSLHDSREHKIEIRDAATGVALAGSPRIFQTTPFEFDLVSETGKLGGRGQVSGVPAGEGQRPATLHFDGITGFAAQGWSVPAADRPPDLFLGFGGYVLCKFMPTLERSDVKESLGLDNGKVGFSAMVGGLLHFSALSAGTNKLLFMQVGQGGAVREVDLPLYYREAYTYAPLKSMTRSFDGPGPGVMREARCFADSRFTMLLEAGPEEINGSSRIHVYFYQEDAPGALRMLGQFDIELAGQLTNLEFRLLAIDRPVLFVLTDGARNLLATDCIPRPDIFLERYAPLIEYHSVLYSGQLFFEVAAKISRSFLDFHLSKTLGEIPEATGVPHRGNTEVLLFVRGDYDAFPSLDADCYRHIADCISFLGRDGRVQGTDGAASLPVEQWIAESDAGFFLVCEIGNTIRPDFWSVVHDHGDSLSRECALVYWDSIWLEGAARPYWVRSQMLLHEAFSRQSLAPINAVMVGRALLAEAAGRQRETFRSGRLRPENAFYFTAPEAVSRLPAVMDLCRLSIPPEMQQQLVEEHRPLLDLDRLPVTDNRDAAQQPADTPAPGDRRSGAGVSIVINYRNWAEATVRCLQSIKLQRFDGPIEVVLVNNGSTPSSVKSVWNAATALFGESNVKAIDYPRRFNHSAQCNLAVRAASHDLIFMLSNDAIIATADAIAQAAELVSIPWVATCGFRIAGLSAKPTLTSMGLALTESRYLFAGVSPIVTRHLIPRFMLDYTISTVGNTFAAAMLRKSVYEELDGLDEAVFPHNYNDVDFCFRATARGYRHVVLGGCLVGHVGRGSREMDLDLPIKEKIMERIPPLSVLTDTFNIVSL